MTRPGGLAWFGATLVWTGAATLSFAGLDGLARSCYISPTLAPLLPLVIDVGVAVAAWVWRRGVNPDAARLAGRLTWSLLVLTIIGNGAHLGMEASRVLPPWWVAALVGAIPPAVAGATAHLLVLLGRVAEEVTLSAADAPVTPSGDQPAEPTPVPRQNVPAGEAALVTLTRELLPIGRRQLARELGVSEHVARQLLEQAKTEQPRNGHKVLEGAK